MIIEFTINCIPPKHTYYVYCHTFPNRKRYIGITKRTPQNRWGKDGYYYLRKRNGRYENPFLANAILHFGWENIKHDILETTHYERELSFLERKYITDVFCSNDRRFGYNIENGGNYCGKLSEKQKNILRKCHIGTKNPMFGKPAHNRGVHPSKEAIEKNRLKHIGKKHKEETKKIISQKLRGRVMAKTTKVICNETKERYNSLKECAASLGFPYYKIKDYMRGRIKNCNGYTFERI